MHITLSNRYTHCIASYTLLALQCRDVKAQAGKTDTRTAFGRQYGDREATAASPTVSCPVLFTMSTLLFCQTNV